MKKVWLMGGFGNVLFQILAFRVLSKKNDNIKYVKKLIEKNQITKFLGWSMFQPTYKEMIDEKEFVTVSSFKTCWVIFLAFLSKQLKKHFKIATFYSEDTQIGENSSKNVFGYFQDKTFLKKNKEELLLLGNDLKEKFKLPSQQHTLVHYRKGDSGWAVKFSYYYDEVKELLKKEKGKVVLVTDSFDDAKEFFKGIENLEIVKPDSALNDFRLLVSAKKLYCAPSTFSWWAAHSLDEDSEVIMPDFFRNNLGIYVKTKKLTIV